MKKFAKEVFVYGLSGTLSRFSGFFLLPIYTRFFSKEEYGLLELCAIVSSITFIIFEAQFLAGYCRYYYEDDEKFNKDKLISTSIVYYSLSWILAIILWYLLGHWFSLIDLRLNKYLLLPCFIGIFPNMINHLVLMYLRLEHKPVTYAWLSNGQVLLTAVLGILTVLFTDWKIKGVLWATASSSLIFIVPSIWIIIKKFNITITLSCFKVLSKYGFPLTPAVVGNWGLASIGGILIAHYLSLADLALYGVANKIGGMIFFAGNIFLVTWQPYALKKFTEKDSEEFFVYSLDLFYIFMFIGVIVVSTTAPLMIKILAPASYFSAYNLVPFIATAALWNCSFNILAAGNGWSGKTYYNAVGIILGAIVNVLLVIILIEKFSLLAVAISLLVGAFIKAVISLYFGQKNHYIPFNISSIINMFILSFIFCIIAYYCKSMPLYIIGSLIVGVISMIIFYFMNLSEVQRNRIKKEIYKYTSYER